MRSTGHGSSPQRSRIERVWRIPWTTTNSFASMPALIGGEVARLYGESEEASVGEDPVDCPVLCSYSER